MQKLKDIFSNSDTYRSIVYLFMAAGITLSPEQQSAIITLGMGISGAIHAFCVIRNSKP